MLMIKTAVNVSDGADEFVSDGRLHRTVDEFATSSIRCLTNDWPGNDTHDFYANRELKHY